jgi:hypothetical protein
MTHDLRGEKHIYSTDLLKRLEELQSDKEIATENGEEFDEELAEELAAIEAIEDELPPRNDGDTMIREDCFEDYARELAVEIGAINGEESWPLNCIDWERAAKELAQDYTTIEFGDFMYEIRSR